MERFDIAIVGGGIVGLATAYALSKRRDAGVGRQRIVVLEKEAAVATHQSGRNSGVIHSGIYYRPGSLKAQTCVRGRERLYRFCEMHGVPFERCGKLLVAVSEEEIPRLKSLADRAEANGLTGVEWVTREAMQEKEPYVHGLAALWIPQTGIVDFRRVAEALAGHIESLGHEVRCGCRVTGIRRLADGLAIQTTVGEFTAHALVNCAGLQCDRIARMCGLRPQVRIVPFRGEYYLIRPERAYLVRHLVYPVPDPQFPFLGVHFTRTITGTLEVGPNAVLSFRREGYSRAAFSVRDTFETFTWPGALRLFSKHWKMGLAEFQRSFSKRAFLRALRRMVPALELDDLLPGPCGVRAQAVARDGSLVDDFLIEVHERTVHVLNAPSPAATASLEIGERIVEMILPSLDSWLR